ncbi:hypothetical protein Isop_3734 (plasmid) [Isosphaera pallida ATCC 43644]|uniref:Uncharacterized protein n=1 Tax=Isosphaera pallida (strain ATCC 43644 / DSM 9630 / IS1B) TaxID=575540 RepID=E8R6U7_ISOPI|nr:hypothetical protein Isop_3734 [Isosphaera pallida ATCC 43644]
MSDPHPVGLASLPTASPSDQISHHSEKRGRGEAVLNPCRQDGRGGQSRERLPRNTNTNTINSHFHQLI